MHNLATRDLGLSFIFISANAKIWSKKSRNSKIGQMLPKSCEKFFVFLLGILSLPNLQGKKTVIIFKLNYKLRFVQYFYILYMSFYASDLQKQN